MPHDRTCRAQRDAARPGRGSGVVFALAIVVLALAGCASTTTVGPPKATPADIAGIASSLRTHGVTIRDLVSGDAGCTDPDMVASAIAFKASGLDQSAPIAVHLYIFRNADSYEKLRSAVDACAASWVSDASGYEAIDASPFVIVGQGPWPPSFKAAVRTSLALAAGDGG